MKDNDIAKLATEQLDNQFNLLEILVDWKQEELDYINNGFTESQNYKLASKELNKRDHSGKNARYPDMVKAMEAYVLKQNNNISI